MADQQEIEQALANIKMGAFQLRDAKLVAEAYTGLLALTKRKEAHDGQHPEVQQQGE